MKEIHFVGIGGIGMSALAAAAKDLGFSVSGSDRGSEKPENRAIFAALKHQGIAIFPQDGSRFAQKPLPETLLYSTAIEENNPDFLAGKGIERKHRSDFLREIVTMSGKTSIAVTGSCGKSTVTCYLTEALANAGCDPMMLAGALDKSVRSTSLAGNYRPGKGKYIVFEADESDKSLLHYGADYAIILNIGTDHYDKQELARVFALFLRQVRRGAVLTKEVFEALKGELPETLPVTVVDPEYDPANLLSLRAYEKVSGGSEGITARALFSDGTTLILPKAGRHMAVNALCIKAVLEMNGFSAADAVRALSRFEGTWRRDDYAGKTERGALVYDDYAHNPEKILSCLKGMRERIPGKLYAVFQPHGYKPFGFMEEELFRDLESFLKPDDRLILMEPFYAGGTSSFKPTALEILAKWREKTADFSRYLNFPDREELGIFLRSVPGDGDLVVIMGARDNSLSDFARSLTEA